MDARLVHDAGGEEEGLVVPKRGSAGKKLCQLQCYLMSWGPRLDMQEDGGLARWFW